MEASIRAATAGDLETLVALMRDFYRQDGDPFAEKESRAAFAALIAEPSWGRVWLAEHETIVVGYAVLTFGFSMEFRGRDAFIDDLYVVPSHRSQGIGRALIAACERSCRDLGIRAVHLELRPTNPAASLYRRLGFRDHQHHLMTKRLEPET
jgi:ribosomal protein S18 acetylase RimI-like enzyme